LSIIERNNKLKRKKNIVYMKDLIYFVFTTTSSGLFKGEEGTKGPRSFHLLYYNNFNINIFSQLLLIQW